MAYSFSRLRLNCVDQNFACCYVRCNTLKVIVRRVIRYNMYTVIFFKQRSCDEMINYLNSDIWHEKSLLFSYILKILKLF